VCVLFKERPQIAYAKASSYSLSIAAPVGHRQGLSPIPACQNGFASKGEGIAANILQKLIAEFKDIAM
jgi:hypothetical protein